MKVHCKTCGKTFDFRCQRGARLKDERCPCGGELAALPGVKRAHNTGRKLVTCAICGSRRYAPGPAKVLDYPFRYDGYDGYPMPGDNPGPHPAGSAVCWLHDRTKIYPIEAAAVLPPAGSQECRDVLALAADLALVDLDTE